MEKHFASLRLLDSDTDWKITEDVNYSQTPSSQRISIKQIYQSEIQPNLIRQYSCDHIFNEHVTTRPVETSEIERTDNKNSNEYQMITEPYYDSFTSFNRQFCKNSNILQAPKFIPNKPLNEILSDKVENVNPTNESRFSLHCPTTNANTINQDHFPSAQLRNCEKTIAEIKPNSDTKIVNKKTYQDIKNKFRPLVLKNKISPKKKINMCYCSCLTLSILPIITVIIAMFLNLNIPTVCNREIFFLNATEELQQKINGQRNAMSQITTHLNQDIFYLKVLCLIGGTGVGKSYTAQIIAKHFPLKEKIFIYDILLNHHTDAYLSKSLDLYQLIILENLKIQNLDIFSNMIDILNQTKPKCVTVIAIFNIEEVNDNLERKIDLTQSINTIREALVHKKIDSLIVPYEPLNEETLQMCIVEAATNSGLTLTLDQINEVKQNLLLFGSGCKGAYAKVQVVGRH
ncbi:uncharacterized protein LOC126922517 isoform X1 [Bombus affinis]|uniref:uncharacterized protein LOC126922517 isoform X1 n=1 Tax=Bombus affinis TaxID=309941 RepID=UPI0021B70102|nr:uncharacterized protein LOC126922517 isoform X1 [Bombus affinis]